MAALAKDWAEQSSYNLLVIGMPNVGKSTLLNALRWVDVEGGRFSLRFNTTSANKKSPAAKALQTSPLPGLTRTTSTPLKLHTEPPIYSVDTPGVMVPFLGRGDEGKERAMKLALTGTLHYSIYKRHIYF